MMIVWTPNLWPGWQSMKPGLDSACLRMINSRGGLAQPGRSFVHHDRARGFATHLTESDNQIVQAVSCIESETDRDVFLNTGARLLSIWLNGEKIFESNNPWAGWHPGKERIPARLRAGRNQIIIESQDAFFLSITNERN